MKAGSILIAAAVYSELEAVWEQVERRSLQPSGGRQIGTGYLNGMPVTILESGPGAYPMTQAMTACLERERPVLVLHVGSGGGFEAGGVRIGDLAAATSEIVIDMGIENPDGRIPLRPLPFPVTGISARRGPARIPLDRSFTEAAMNRLRAVYEPAGVRTLSGVFVTGSMVTATDRRADELFQAYQPVMESMEGAAAAFVSAWYGIPMVEIRCASNRVGDRKRSDWNLSLACRRAGEAAVAVLSHVAALVQEPGSGT